MSAHIKELIRRYLVKVQRSSLKPGDDTRHGNAQDWFRAVLSEIERLEVMDFEPEARADFSEIRNRLLIIDRSDATIMDYANFATDMLRLSELMASFRGTGSGACIRDFSFVHDTEIRRIVERDYRELAQITFPDQAWKSTVILAGSILEAVLYDRLTRDDATILKAMASPQAPSRGLRAGGGKKDLTLNDRDNEWRLVDMIKVACDLGILDAEDEKATHGTLRNYRNFVHPRCELDMGLELSEGHATAAKGMLDVILDRLASTVNH